MFFGTPGTTKGRWTVEEAGQRGCCNPSVWQWEGGMGHPDACLPSLLPASSDFVLTWAGGIYLVGWSLLCETLDWCSL